MIVTDTKSKLEDEKKQQKTKKTNKFFLSVFSKFIWWKITEKEAGTIFYYGCIIFFNFLFLSHLSLS